MENGKEEVHPFADAILEMIREPFLLLDADLHVVSANPAFYRTFRVSPEEVLGRDLDRIARGRWGERDLRALLDARLSRQAAAEDVEVVYTSGAAEQQVMLLRARRVDADRILLLVEDLTERRELERRQREGEEQFRLLLENAKEYAIFTMDPEGAIVMWSPGAERILGWTETEVIGRQGDLIFTPEDRARNRSAEEQEEARLKGSAEDERWHVRKSGERFWASGMLITLRDRDREIRGFTKILRDNTRRKQAEDGLLELKETLEQRVEERTRQVFALVSELTLAEQRERHRIAGILHDHLQQLLYGIQLRVQILREEVPEVAQEQIQQLRRLLGEAISTTRTLTVDLSPPLLKEGLEAAITWLAEQMGDLYGLQVEVAARGPVQPYSEEIRVMLFQIVRELLFNVVKHAGVREARVELFEEGEHCLIRVEDRGRGFDLAILHAPRSERRFGLSSIAHRLRLFGGRIEVVSTPGEGTRVTIFVPTHLKLPPGAIDPGIG